MTTEPSANAEQIVSRYTLPGELSTVGPGPGPIDLR